MVLKQTTQNSYEFGYLNFGHKGKAMLLISTAFLISTVTLAKPSYDFLKIEGRNAQKGKNNLNFITY
jgi:hypothetical protein